MRIVLLNQYYLPSEAPTALLLADLAEALARAGHETTVVASRRPYDGPSRLYPPRERIAGVEVRRTWTPARGRSRGWGRLADYLTYLGGAALRSLVVPRPDVLVAMTTPPMLPVLGVLAARARGCRSVAWVMDVYPDLAFAMGWLREESLAGRALGALGRFALRRADAVVTLGEDMAARARRGGAREVRVVRNWADGQAIRPLPATDHPLRREWGWDGRFVVMYSGNMGLAHEFETVLDAAERLRDDPRVRLAFVGDGPRRGEIEVAVRERRLPNVELRPYVSRESLGLGLTAGDLHLVTLRPGLGGLLAPSKVYGVLAAGRPVVYVGPPEGEVYRTVREAACGRTVECGDAEGLTAAIRSYAADVPARETAGRAAREAFERHFSRERAVARFVELLETVARG